MLLNEMEIFFSVVMQSSFSKAADRLGVSKSFISKKISKLEADLQVRLLHRSTRRLVLTEAGKAFFKCCDKVVKEAQTAYSVISELQGQPSGTLKISMPPAFGLHMMQDVLSEYIEKFPNVTLNVHLDNRLVDVIKDNYDLVFRSANLESSNLIAQRILKVESILCASPGYLAKHGQPTIPQDLMEHQMALYHLTAKKKSAEFYDSNSQLTAVNIKGTFISNHSEMIKERVLRGDCMAILPRFVVRREIDCLLVTHCLENYSIKASNLYVVYPEREFMAPKVREFLALVKKHIQS